jgi:hypothetical protein
VKPTFLPVALKNTMVSMSELLPDVLVARPRLVFFEQICILYRRLAVGTLLLSADVNEFCSYLYKSARAFVYFAETAPLSAQLTSKAIPFLDAIACGDDDDARRIAVASPPSPSRGCEYEEDFFYLRLLMDLAVPRVTMPASEAMLSAWASFAADNPDPRFDVVRSLYERDQDLFDSAVTTAIRNHKKRYEKLGATDALSPDDAATLAHISIDLLAWLSLAQRTGLHVADEYPLAPGLARCQPVKKFPHPDSWRVWPPPVLT